MKRSSIIAILFMVCSNLSVNLIAADETSATEKYFHSEYMSCTQTFKEINANAYRVQLKLEFAPNMATGTGTLTIDPNNCSINEFGDPGSCTKKNYTQLKFKFAGIKLADPLGLGRTIYEIDLLNTTERDSLFLVLSKDDGDDARLVYNFNKEAVSSVIYLKKGPFPYM